MSEPKDSLYDITDAIALSRKLAGDRATVKKTSIHPEEESYIRFSAGITPAAEPRPAPAAAVPSVVPPAPSHGPLPTGSFHNWDEALAWCVEFTKAQCGFIVDSQGFVMMTHGTNLPPDGFEGTGANLGSVFSDLSRLEIDGGKVHIADMTYDKHAFLALRIVDGTGEHCTIGILSEHATHEWPKHLVYSQIMKNMTHLLL